MKHLTTRSAQLTMAVALTAFAAALPAVAQPGPAPSGTAIAEYTASTGVIIVSVSNVSNWYVESSSMSMTGPDDVGSVLPLAPGSDFVSNNPNRVGEVDFGGSFSYTNINLGAVAAPGLPEGDLMVWWNAAGTGSDLLFQPVICIGCSSSSTGDFNADNSIDGTDFILWQRGQSPSPFSSGDLALWESGFGTAAAAPTVAAIPEPTGLALIGLGLSSMLMPRRRQQA